MRLVLCAVRALLLGILLVALVPTSDSLGRGASRAVILVISPASDVSVPVGQALEVRYCVSGAATKTELWSDGEPILVEPVVSGQEVTHVWAPIELGVHHLTACAFDATGAVLVRIERTVIGLPPGSPVRLSSASEDASNEPLFPSIVDPRCIPRGGES